MKLSRNNPNLLYIRVSKDAVKGFWEVNLLERKALFRDKESKLLPSDNLEDYTEIYKTIEDFLIDKIDNANKTKVIIPNRKVIFSDTEICSHEEPNQNNPGKAIHCTEDAWLYVANKPYCKEHCKTHVTL